VLGRRVRMPEDMVGCLVCYRMFSRDEIDGHKCVPLAGRFIADGRGKHATAILELRALSELEDAERIHGRADEILLEFIDAVGGEPVAAAYRALVEKVGFWYA
jgi:hypothetical protein